jgi:hypothetical protein
MSSIIHHRQINCHSSSPPTVLWVTKQPLPRVTPRRWPRAQLVLDQPRLQRHPARRSFQKPLDEAGQDLVAPTKCSITAWFGIGYLAQRNDRAKLAGASLTSTPH